MDHPHNYGSSKSKRSYTEIAAAATAGDDCPQPQLVPLPLPVEQKLNSICEEKGQPQPDAALRRRLGLLGEEKALELLGEIYNSKNQIKTLSGYIWLLLREKYQCTPRSRSPSPSPTKSGPAASPPLHSPSSASQITPGRQGSTSGGQKQLNSYFSPSPLKSARTSPFRGPSSSLPISPVHEGPSSAPPTSITPVQLFQGDTTDNRYFQSSRASNVNATAKVSNYKSSLEKVKIPNDLKPRSFPHYMGKLNSYKSTSILGSIYDAVEEYQPEDTSDEVVEKLPCFDVEDLPEQCLKKWYELYEQFRSEMTSVLQYDDKEGKNKAADKLIRRYKEILYGCEDLEKSTRPLDEIFNEALAIYRFAYDYAWKVNDVRKCGFAWRVAGSALCKYYKTKHEDRAFEVSFSVLKDIL